MFGCQGSLQGVEFKITWRFHPCPLFVCMIVNGFFECECYTRQGHKCRTRQENKRENLRKSIERRQNTHLLAASWIRLVPLLFLLVFPLSTPFLLPGVFPHSNVHCSNLWPPLQPWRRQSYQRSDPCKRNAATRRVDSANGTKQGHIRLDQYTIDVMDTVQFQRLRDLKQV